VVSIDVLPDDVLLTIFDFYVVRFQNLNFTEAMFGNPETKRKIESWQSLVHVCRRWRGLVFGSSIRLNLQLFYIGTSARKSLDVWPALPLLIQSSVSETSVDSVIAELEHADRICQIDLLSYPTSQIEKLWTAMQVPFPELAVLYLSYMDCGDTSYGDMPYRPVLPDSLLGGFAPRLRFLALTSISFPGLPKLLLFSTHLVVLFLYNIPHSGYISPEVMTTCLSVLTNLEELHFQFYSPQSSPDQESRRPPPPTRSVLPALRMFSFKGVNEYLEELVARIDTPRLHRLWTTFFNDIDFDTPELIQFISRTLTSEEVIEAHVVFGSSTAWVGLELQASYFEEVKVEISCEVLNWQLSSLSQICTSSLPLLSTTENLYIHEHLQSQLDGKDGIEDTEWLELLLPFTAVKDLYLSKQFAPRITPALQELTGGRTVELLPTLQNLFLEGFQPSEPVHEGIAQFISARQLTKHPVAISVWERDLTQERLWEF
jgi:F-box-like